MVKPYVIFLHIIIPILIYVLNLRCLVFFPLHSQYKPEILFPHRDSCVISELRGNSRIISCLNSYRVSQPRPSFFHSGKNQTNKGLCRQIQFFQEQKTLCISANRSARRFLLRETKYQFSFFLDFIPKYSTDLHS